MRDPPLTAAAGPLFNLPPSVSVRRCLALPSIRETQLQHIHGWKEPSRWAGAVGGQVLLLHGEQWEDTGIQVE